MSRIKMMVFDMAGTTVDENNVVYKTLCKALNKHGMPIRLETVLEVGAGKEKFQATKDILKTQSASNFVDAHAVFKDFTAMLHEAYATLEVTPIKGVETVLLDVRKKNIKVVLNTGYSNKIANALLEKLQWKKNTHYDALITADDVVKGRPHPDMIFKAMELFNIKDPASVLKAGDSSIDIEEGKNANCGITVGVLSGAQTKEQLQEARPDYILNSLAEINIVNFT